MPTASRLSARLPSEIEASLTANHRALLAGFVRLHRCHHAAQAPLVGCWIIEELAGRGDRLSPGTLYPMLRRMERRGRWRAVALRREGRRTSWPYTATKEGRVALAQAKPKRRERFHQRIEEDEEPPKTRARQTP